MIPQEEAAAFVRWQKKVVLPKKHRTESTEAAQARLAEVVRGGSKSLVEYLIAELGLDESLPYGAPRLPRRLTAGEAGDPPPELEKEIADAFSYENPSKGIHPVTPELAIRSVFWTIAHVQWLRRNCIEEDWVRKLEGKNDDATARNVCRRLGGLPHIRGRISVLNDCPISRAWWRVRIAKQSAEAAKGCLSTERAYKALKHNALWAELIGGCVRNVAVVNEPRALAAICVNISRNFKYGSTPPKNYARDIARTLARHSSSVSLHVVPFEELLRICDKAAAAFDPEAVVFDETEQDDEDN